MVVVTPEEGGGVTDILDDGDPSSTVGYGNERLSVTINRIFAVSFSLVMDYIAKTPK